MKLTLAPPATQSASTSASSPFTDVAATASRTRISGLLIWLFRGPRAAREPGIHNHETSVNRQSCGYGSRTAAAACHRAALRADPLAASGMTSALCRQIEL